jgi:hypothetical protein
MELIVRFMRFQILLLLLPGLAAAQPMAALQYQYTAFVNVGEEFKASLARCKVVAPESVPKLEALFESWRKEHGASQPILQKMIRDELRQHFPTDSSVEEHIQNTMREAKKGPVPANFPTEILKAGDCLETIPAVFRGERLKIQFKDYVEQLTAKK